MVAYTVNSNLMVIFWKRFMLYFYRTVCKLSTRLQGFIYILTLNYFLKHSDQLALQIRNQKSLKSLEISCVLGYRLHLKN